MSLFLTKEKLVALTGRKIKSLQIEQLRKMGVLFWVNALGAPVVARAAMEGRHNETGTHKPWWVPDF